MELTKLKLRDGERIIVQVDNFEVSATIVRNGHALEIEGPFNANASLAIIHAHGFDMLNKCHR